jgi:ATP-dependent Clp protease ATP-binding subunit ClpA
MTTNVGAAEMAQNGIGFTKDFTVGKEQKALKDAFTPEFRNRLDAQITFKPLQREVMLQIVDKFLLELSEQLKAKKVTLTLSLAAREHLAEKGYDPLFGARPLRRLVEELLSKPLSKAILFGKLKNGGNVTFDRKSEELEMTVQNRRHTTEEEIVQAC